MKKVFLLTLLISLGMACTSEEESISTVNSIEGKWLFSADTPGISAQGISNTMYIFENGKRYTYYCIAADCESQYMSFTAGDGNHLPAVHNYTFENGTLTIDLNFGNELVAPLSFECSGNKVYLASANPHHLVKLGSDCE